MMGKCLNCSKEVKQHDGKRNKLYCGEACKKAYQRKAKLVDNGTKSISGHNGTDISGQDYLNPQAKIDWSKLTSEQKAKRWAKIKAAGAVLTGGYEMTATERASYKPASELGKAEHNPVSKPGDVDYNGVCTPEWIAERKA